jgi:hypothetical protein
VIYDWNNAAAIGMLTTCARTMRDDSRIVLIEHLLRKQTLVAPVVIQGDLHLWR